REIKGSQHRPAQRIGESRKKARVSRDDWNARRFCDFDDLSLFLFLLFHFRRDFDIRFHEFRRLGKLLELFQRILRELAPGNAWRKTADIEPNDQTLVVKR